MKLKVKTILSVFLFASVYTAFFTVQIFFNFDIPSNAQVTLNHQTSGPVIKKNVRNISSTQNNSSKKTIFRLNKRFHPETLCCINQTSINKLPEQFYILINPSGYQDAFIPVCITENRSLRGPPVAA